MPEYFTRPLEKVGQLYPKAGYHGLAIQPAARFGRHNLWFGLPWSEDTDLLLARQDKPGQPHTPPRQIILHFFGKLTQYESSPVFNEFQSLRRD